ncbi:MAG: tripartite tricarboxylate transporter permease [Candidatus Diapherotrites archaeon]|nr:tripartite tricarboxylate transporter permease [Candidatus Diapherotrites archaeon]
MTEFGLLLTFVLAGWILGTFTGFIPGIHGNLIAGLLVLFFSSSNEYLAMAIISASITHVFSEWISAQLLQWPTETGYLFQVYSNSKTSFQELIHQGFIAGLLAIIFALGLSSILFFIQPILQTITFHLLILVLGLLIVSAGTWKKTIYTIAIIGLAGILGLIALNSLTFRDPLLPCITGFFGISTLLQELFLEKMKTKELTSTQWSWKNNAIGTGIGLNIALIPSITIGEQTLAAQEIFGKKKGLNWQNTIACASIASLVASFILAETNNLARTGQSALMKEMLSGKENLILILGVILFTLGLSYLSHSFFAKKISAGMQNFPVKLFSVISLIFLIAINFILGSWLGLFLLIISTSIGLLPLLTGTHRSSCMSFLLIPTLIFYFPFG